VGKFDQHFEELLPMDKTPVAFLRSEFDLTEHEARKTLGQFGLDGPRHLIAIRDLSGGQKARVVFASLSQQQAHVLILDEVCPCASSSIVPLKWGFA
jgi:ATP-binding cassette subfamily F protein 1